MILLVSPGLLYFAATSVFPNREDDTVSVHAFVVASARSVNLPLALWMLWAIGGNLYDAWPNWRGAAFGNFTILLAATALGIAACARHDRARWAATLAVLAYNVVFLIIYLPSIGA